MTAVFQVWDGDCTTTSMCSCFLGPRLAFLNPVLLKLSERCPADVKNRGRFRNGLIKEDIKNLKDFADGCYWESAWLLCLPQPLHHHLPPNPPQTSFFSWDPSGTQVQLGVRAALKHLLYSGSQKLLERYTLENPKQWTMPGEMTLTFILPSPLKKNLSLWEANSVRTWNFKLCHHRGVTFKNLSYLGFVFSLFSLCLAWFWLSVCTYS